MSKSKDDGMYLSPIPRRVATLSGHILIFKANEPKFVPEIARPEMLEYGILPVNGDLPIEEVTVEDKVVLVGAARTKAIDDAINQLVEENDNKNFSASGVPHVKSIEAIIGFDISAKDRDKAWKANRAAATAAVSDEAIDEE